jgi:hypothetical protein
VGIRLSLRPSIDDCSRYQRALGAHASISGQAGKISHHFQLDRALVRSSVGRDVRVRIGKTVLHPLHSVAVHVIQTELIRREGSDRRSFLPLVPVFRQRRAAIFLAIIRMLVRRCASPRLGHHVANSRTPLSTSHALTKSAAPGSQPVYVRTRKSGQAGADFPLLIVFASPHRDFCKCEPDPGVHSTEPEQDPTPH